jgi:RHS repeat-associated protein
MTGKARRHHATGNHYDMSGCISDNGCVSLFWYDADGTVEQIINYYPFGAPFADPETVVDADLQPYKYNGKELDRMHGLDTYDYGARQYNPILARWDRMDPLCEKYYNVSPYGYCGGNPVRYIDPDGKKIVMSQKNSQDYNLQYNNAINYLKEHGCSSLISYLEESPIEITIEEIGSNEQNYTAIDLGVNKIGWKARQGLLTDLGYKLSPAIRLFHELAHQEHKLRNPDQFLKDTELNKSLYQTKDDESIIKNEETNAARKCGEIPQDAVTRETHYGINFETTNSTSRDIININDDIRTWQDIWGECDSY